MQPNLKTFVDKLKLPAILVEQINSSCLIVAINEAYCKLSGYSEIELLHRKAEDVFATTDKVLKDKIAQTMLECDFWEGETTAFKKGKNKPTLLNTTVMGVVVDGKRYYCIIKREIGSRNPFKLMSFIL